MFKGEQSPKSGNKTPNSNSTKNKSSTGPKSPGLAHAAIAVSAGLIGGPPTHDALIPNGKMMKEIGDMARTGQDIVEYSLAELGVQGIKKRPDGVVVVTLDSPKAESASQTKTDQTPEQAVDPDEIYPRTVSTGPLAGKYASGHFLRWLGMSAPGPIPSEVTLHSPIEVIRGQIEEKFLNNPDTPEKIITELQQQAEVLKDVDNSNLARMSLDEYASRHLEPLIQQVRDHILLPNRTQGVMEKPGYERVGWYIERYNVSLQDKYKLSDQELATFETLLKRIDSRTLLAFIITEFFGSDESSSGAELSVDMFDFCLKHYGLLTLAHGQALGDAEFSRGIGHTTRHVEENVADANELISQLSRSYSTDFTSVQQWNTPQRQTIAVLLNIISNLHIMIKQANDDPVKLKRLEDLFEGKSAVEVLAAMNNRPASLYEALDGVGYDKSLSDILNAIAANTGEKAHQIVARYVAVGNKIFISLKNRQDTHAVAGTPSETPPEEQ